MAKSPEPREKSNGRSAEVAALLVAARAVLENPAFEDAAKAILVACKSIVGADAGFVGVCPVAGKGLEIAALDPGTLELDPDVGLPPPLRRLGERALATGHTIVADDLSKDGGAEPPAGPARFPEVALVTPMLVAGEVMGLVGLINKPGGFSAADSQLAEVFAVMAAVALRNSRTFNGLERNRASLESELSRGEAELHEAEELFQTLIENLPDIIARFDRELRYLYASPAIEPMIGRPAGDCVGKTNRELGLTPEVSEPWDAAVRHAFATGQPERIEFAYPATDGIRYFDCRLVPESEPGDTVTSVLSVARDVTDRWLALEAERQARTIAEALHEATLGLTRSLDPESVLVTLLDRLRGLVPFDRARVMLVEEAPRLSIRAIFDGERAMPLPAEARPELNASEHPVVHNILTNGTPVLIPDISAHPDWSLPTEREAEASWMGVPLFTRGRVTGLFSLSKREADYFKEEHVRLAEALSSQASVAVENAILFEQMQASTVRMRALSRRLVETQESERRQIALELHDEAGQALTSLRHGLRLLERETTERESVAARVRELVRTTDDVIDGLHRLAADLRPASLDHLGLDAALRQYARWARSKFGLPVHFKARGFTSARLPQAVETSLYRIVQEAITNVVRHARATKVDLMVERRGDKVRVLIEDDGTGFDPSRVHKRDHYGLLGMRERTEALGGTLTVESSHGKGTTIAAEVPDADPHPDS